MKKTMTKCALCLALLLCCVAIFAACGPKNNPTPTYKALRKYIKSEGGALSYDDLTDSTYGEVDIRVHENKYAIYFEFTWFVRASIFDSSHAYRLIISFSRNQNEPVSVDYYDSSDGNFISIHADCDDITTPSYGFKVQSASKNQQDISSSSSEYKSAVNTAKRAVQNLQTWISAIVSVALDDDSLTVQDLYNPS